MKGVTDGRATMPAEMKRSWLVQRLKAPVGYDNPFSFGGGHRNGGLSDDAMNLLRGIFSFDYMGAAEFEFGAVPKALQMVARSAAKKSLGAWSTKVLDKEIYIIAPNAWRSEVENRICAFARGRENLKAGTHLRYALGEPDREEARGWLELDNGFFFFVDEVMWTKTAELFGVTKDAGINSEAQR